MRVSKVARSASLILANLVVNSSALTVACKQMMSGRLVARALTESTESSVVWRGKRMAKPTFS